MNITKKQKKNKRMKIKFIVVISLFLLSHISTAQNKSDKLMVSGALSNVMKKGQLKSTIFLDSISDKKNLYGLGPKHFLTGELLIVDGRSFVSSIDENQEIKMEETFHVKAPFFVYTNVTSWNSEKLPKKITSMQELEQYLVEKSKVYKGPFAFRLKGVFKKINFHIQNLPEGTQVKSHKDAHQGQKKYLRKNVEGEIIGFFSTQHQGVFTHHNQYIHMHFINKNRTEMGHIDELKFSKNSQVKLYLP